MKLFISKQEYPDHQGVKLKSFAIWLKRPWRRKQFVGYSWSRLGAERAIQELERMK